MSDLHLEFDKNFKPMNTAKNDILLLAGDIVPFKFFNPNSPWYDITMAFFEHISKEFPEVLYIPGNHEYYGGSDISKDLPREFNKVLPENITLFNNRYFLRDDVMIVGGTLWTDFHGGNPLDMQLAWDSMNDYRSIKDSKSKNWKLTPMKTLQLHREAAEFIEEHVTHSGNKKTLVMTHHTPSYQSCDEEFKGDKLNSAYHTDMSWLFDDVDAWVHGHVHNSNDYDQDGTRIISNPKGYHDQNKKFNPNFSFSL